MKPHLLHLVRAEYVDGHRLRVAFDDGSQGTVDLGMELDGEIFEPLRATEEFRRFTLAGGTVVWSNGADFAPEFLRAKLEQANVGSPAGEGR